MDPRIPHAARLQQQKNYPAAEQIYRLVLLNQPKNADALLLLGLLLHETGRLEAAIETLQRARSIDPHRAEIRQTLIAALVAMGRSSEAIVEAKEVVRLRPLVGESHLSLAQLLLKLPDYSAALGYARRATELQPKSPLNFVVLSRTYLGLLNTPLALEAVDRALAIDPNYGDALIDKGQLLQTQGRLGEAIAHYEAGLKVFPSSVAALNNLGACYLMKTRPVDAIGCFEAAAKIWPHSPKPRNNVGAALKDLGQIDDAINQFQRAIEIDPAYSDSYCNLGGCYDTIGEHEKALATYRAGLIIDPNSAAIGSNLLMALLTPTHLSAQEVFDEHVAWNTSHASKIIQQPLVVAKKLTGRRLKIAYVSPDFREHSVRYFIEPVLAHHDRSQFEVICYAIGRRRDDVTTRLATLVDGWFNIAELSDQQLADLIRSHQVDVLIDLAGHTSDNRLLTFARRPAPVQVTYLGYPTTSGLATMDYRLTDRFCDPPGADAFYTEKLVRLPHAFFAYDDDAGKPFDPGLPADRNGVFTFGSFNSFTKFNDQTLDSWATILSAAHNTRLLIKAKPLENPSTRERVAAFFIDRGITGDRLDLRTWMTLEDHFSLLASGIDLELDTYPYNGHTTTCQALWMGVPVVTRAGDSFRSRVGHTIMQNLKLSQFIADSKQRYEQIAIELATDWNILRVLRPTLRQRMIESPLCDARGFTRCLEAAYEQMWSAAVHQ